MEIMIHYEKLLKLVNNYRNDGNSSVRVKNLEL